MGRLAAADHWFRRRELSAGRMIGNGIQDRSGPGAEGRLPVLFLISLQVVVFWPVWEWWMFRMIRFADNRPALAAPLLGAVICAALVLTATGKPAPGLRPGEVSRLAATGAVLMAAFAVLWLSVHPLLPAVVAVGCLAWSAASVLVPRARSGLAALMILGLPVLPSLQTHLGYPMRLFTTVVGAVWLRLMGVPVVRDGLGLQWHEQLVLVDEPCSGVRMLWSGLVLAMALAAVHGLSVARTCLLGGAALGAVVIGNLFRSVGVFFLETGPLHGNSFMHEGIGLAAFAGAAAFLVYAARGIQRWRYGFGGDGGAAAGTRGAGWRRWTTFPGKGIAGVYLTVCIGAALVPLVPDVEERGNAAGGVSRFPGWPSRFEGTTLQPAPMGRREKAFYDEFPGEVGCFSDGSRQIILRWAADETDKFHLSSACLKGVGYAVEPRGDEVDSDGIRWGTLLAIRGAETLKIRERIHDGSDGNWTSEAAWRWSRLWRRTTPPWWGITVIEVVAVNRSL